MFDIDLNKLVKQLMPHFLFKPKHYAWLTVLLFPIIWLYSEFLTYRTEKLREATINSQVNRLTLALQEEFNNDGIYIIHPGAYLDQAFIYLEIEGATPEFDYLAIEEHEPVDYDALQAEYDGETDFTVRVPSALTAQQARIKLFVDKFRFFGKRFKIEIY